MATAIQRPTDSYRFEKI